MIPARTALAALTLAASAIHAAPALAQEVGDRLSTAVAELLPDEPGAAVLLLHSSDGETNVVSSGTAFWEAVDVGAGPALLGGVSSDENILLVFERADQPNRYNIFVHILRTAGSSLRVGTPITLRNATGQIVADSARPVQDGFVLSARLDQDPGFEDADSEFIRRTVGSEWLALSFESEDGVAELLFRPDDFGRALAEVVLQRWSAADLQQNDLAPVLNRPLELSIGDNRFGGTALWRAGLGRAPSLQIGAFVDGIDLSFSIRFFYTFWDGYLLGVNTIRDGEIDDAYAPTVFRMGTGENYFPISPPLETTNGDTGWILAFSPPSMAHYRALVEADFFEIVFEHEGDALVLRLDKSDPRGHAIAEVMFGEVIDAFEQREREAAP